MRVWFDHVAAARMPDVRPEDLKSAWAALIQRARVNRHHLVTREQLSVRSEMSRVLKMLESSRYVEFTTLFLEHADVPHLVVTFLALLELAREQLVGDRADRAVCPDPHHAVRRARVRARRRRLMDPQMKDDSRDDEVKPVADAHAAAADEAQADRRAGGGRGGHAG